MGIKENKLLTCSPDARNILLASEIGDTIEFADGKINVGKSNIFNCCNYCAFAKEHEQNVKCPHFDLCSAHNRPDKQSVCFYDEEKIKKKNGYYKRLY